MRKILMLVLVFGLVIGCVGVVSATMDITVSTASPKAGESVTFTVTGYPNNVTKYNWTVNNIKQDGEQHTFTHTFSTAGSYSVGVTAYNNTTSVGTASETVTVSASIVTPVLGTLTSNKSSGGPAPLTVLFTVAVTTGNPTGYEWNFGGTSNETSTTNTKTHTFREAGTYTVSVVAVNGTVKSEPRTLPITVTASHVPVVSQLTANVTNGRSPLSVLFTATATNSPTEYAWTFGDGTASQTTTTNTVTHVFNKAGTHTVNVTAKNVNGTSAVKSIPVVINANTSGYKVAIEATPEKGVAPLTVKFRLNTTIPTDEIRSEAEKGYEWDFGYDSNDDGTNEYSYSRKPKDQTYSKDGTYTVKVTVKTKLGDPYNAEIKITVSDLLAAFDASATSGPAPLEVKFTDKSSGPTSWKWSIYKTDDGSRTLQKELTNQNITYTFDREGKYEVELAAKKGSKSVTTYKEIVVSAKATTAPTTKATTKATTAPTTAAATMEARAAALSAEDSPVPNPMDIIEEFIRLLKVMLVPDNYNLAP